MERMITRMLVNVDRISTARMISRLNDSDTNGYFFNFPVPMDIQTSLSRIIFILQLLFVFSILGIMLMLIRKGLDANPYVNL